MKTVDEYPLKSLIRLCDYKGTDKFDGCLVSKGTMQAGYVLPLFRLKECFMLLCTSGEIHVELDEREHTLSPFSLLVCPANSDMQMECHRVADFVCVILTPCFLNKNYNYWKQIMPLMIETKLKRRYIIPLTKAETMRYEYMTDCVMDYMHCGTPYGWTKETISSGVKTLLSAVFGKMELLASCDEGEPDTGGASRREEYFSRFMNLLSIHFKKERKVGFYASELCVTPKYLSTVVKEVSGKTPSKWIDEVVMEEIRYLLKNSNMPMKEIAYRLNFANSSFFGKFFKAYTGVSPLQYRMCDMPANPVPDMEILV